MKKQKTSHQQDLILLVAMPLLSALACWSFNLNFLSSTLLFFGLPALYLSYRDPGRIQRAAIFAIFFAAAGTYTDYMAERDLAWAEPSSVLRFRVMGLVPVESILWFFLLTYLIIMFYEHFFDHLTHRPVGRRMKLLYAILILATLVFFTPLALHKTLPVVGFFYLKLGLLLGLLPLTAFTLEFPRFISVFLKTAPYFFGLSLLNELVGLRNHHWIFPGSQFVGWVTLGSFRFPLEEVLFWMVMFSSVVVTYFELFDDNRLRFRPLAALFRR